jgi:lipid-binding SYLF domain-containing protein
MKIAVTLCALCISATSAFAAPSKDEVKRLTNAGTILTELRNAPDKGIPDHLWSKAQCVVVIPSMKKVAFVVGGEYGSGVMSCRAGGGWSSPVFMQLAKGSWGLQIGGEEIDLVLLVMNKRGVDKLLEDKVALGGDVAVAAGPLGRSATAATDAQMGAEMLAYSRAQGVFAGIDLSGGVLRPDKDADARAYGANAKAADIIGGVNHMNMPAEAAPFTAALKAETRQSRSRQ